MLRKIEEERCSGTTKHKISISRRLRVMAAVASTYRWRTCSNKISALPTRYCISLHCFLMGKNHAMFIGARRATLGTLRYFHCLVTKTAALTDALRTELRPAT